MPEPTDDEKVKFRDPMLFGYVTAQQSVYMVAVYFLIRAMWLPLHTTLCYEYAAASFLTFVCAYFDFPMIIFVFVEQGLVVKALFYTALMIGSYLNEGWLEAAQRLVADAFQGYEKVDLDRETVTSYLNVNAFLLYRALYFLRNAEKTSDYKKKRAAEEDEVGVPQLSL